MIFGGGAQPPFQEPSELAPEPETSVHKWLQQASYRVGKTSIRAAEEEEEEGPIAKQRPIASLARPSKRKLSKGRFSEKGRLLTAPKPELTPRTGAVAVGSAVSAAAANTDSSRAWAVAARCSGASEGSTPTWAQLDTVLGDLNATMTSLLSPSCASNQLDVMEKDAGGDVSVAAGSSMPSDVGQRASTHEGELSEEEALDDTTSSNDAPELDESVYATTDDGQSTLQEFSGTEDSASPSARSLPAAAPAKVEDVALAATGDKELRTVAATWAAERGISLEGGGVEDMYKYF